MFIPMMPSGLRKELLEEYLRYRDVIRRRLEDFRRVPARRYFYELCYCILTPQSSAAQCDKVVRELERLRFRTERFDPESLLRSHEGGYVRFHRTKARRLLLLNSCFSDVGRLLSSGRDTKALRVDLVQRVTGLGMKEASHFLRNIGRTDVTIIDRHIIRNLLRLGLISEWPRSISTKRYLHIEAIFESAALELGIPSDELDLLLWRRETGFILK
jgi:N-glycosylase/DNA lyase